MTDFIKIFIKNYEETDDAFTTYRNPRLVNILSKSHYIENFGTGIPRILETYKETDKKPIFNPSENFFILKLPNMNYLDPITDPIADPIADELRDKTTGFFNTIICFRIRIVVIDITSVSSYVDSNSEIDTSGGL